MKKNSMTHIMVVLAVLVVLLVMQLLALVLALRRSHEAFSQAMLEHQGDAVNAAVPGLLWTYWEDPAGATSPDELARRCWCNWRGFHPPPARINIVQAHDAHLFVSCLDAPDDLKLFRDATPSQRRRLVRMAVLAEHGGVYLEPYSVLTTPLDLTTMGEELEGRQGYWACPGGSGKAKAALSDHIARLRSGGEAGKEQEEQEHLQQLQQMLYDGPSTPPGVIALADGAVAPLLAALRQFASQGVSLPPGSLVTRFLSDMACPEYS